jgi:hypothetical protein
MKVRGSLAGAFACLLGLFVGGLGKGHGSSWISAPATKLIAIRDATGGVRAYYVGAYDYDDSGIFVLLADSGRTALVDQRTGKFINEYNVIFEASGCGGKAWKAANSEAYPYPGRLVHLENKYFQYTSSSNSYPVRKQSGWRSFTKGSRSAETNQFQTEFFPLDCYDISFLRENTGWEMDDTYPLNPWSVLSPWRIRPPISRISRRFG